MYPFYAVVLVKGYNCRIVILPEVPFKEAIEAQKLVLLSKEINGLRTEQK